MLMWITVSESVSSCDHTNPRSNYVIASVNENKSSCLVCPISKEEKSLLWTRTDENETILFRDDIRRFNEREHSINVNDDHCHIQNYSLKLSNMPANDSSGQYTCWYNGSVVTTFCVLLQGIKLKITFRTFWILLFFLSFFALLYDRSEAKS